MTTIELQIESLKKQIEEMQIKLNEIENEVKSENEDIVDYALENGFDLDFCKIKVNKNTFSTGSSVNENVYIKIFPDKIWEGFFVAKLHKK